MPSVEVLPWEQFQNLFFREWKQGEHVALVGPTGGGKTNLTRLILPRRNYVAVFATKPKDSTMMSMSRSDGYKIIRKWPPKPKDQRVILWPQLTLLSGRGHQEAVISDALAQIFVDGNWCISLDELRYVTEQLNQEQELEMFWMQGRSLGISVVAATERPAMVPLTMYDQSTHLFFWRDNDERNLKRISGIGWLNADMIRHTVANLPLHEVLYVNTRTGRMIQTKPRKA